MNAIQKLSLKVAAFSALLFLPFSAFAGTPPPTMVINTAAAGTQGIPTLSGTMLVVLSLLLFAVAARVAKQKKSNINKMLVTLLGIGSLSMITGGMQIITKADAALHGALIDKAIILESMLGESSIELDFGNPASAGGYNLFSNQNPDVVVSIIRIENGEFCGDTPDNTYFTDEPSAEGGSTRTPVPDNQTCSAGITLGNGASCDITCIPRS